jgi:NhaP-type Na+/H+ and K+/H+ antiporter
MRYVAYEVVSSWLFLVAITGSMIFVPRWLPFLQGYFDGAHDPKLLTTIAVSGVIAALGTVARYAARPVAVRFNLAPKAHSQAFSSFCWMAGSLLSVGSVLAIAGLSQGAERAVMFGGIAAIIGFAMLAFYGMRRHQFVKAVSPKADLAANSVESPQPLT